MKDDSSNLHNYVYSSDMMAFVTVSNKFCRYFEQLKEVDGKVFISESVKLLSEIYSSFVKLGNTEPVYESPGESTVNEQDWAAVYQQISMILGPHNDYLRLAGESEFDRSEVVTHTIAEDSTDVYQELRDFTTIYSRGMEEYMNDAAWELKTRFAEHWGIKLLRSLKELHELYVAGVDPTNEG